MTHRVTLTCLVSYFAALISAHAGALDLDGNGDFVTFPSAGIPSGSSAFTIEAWVNPDVHGDSTITFWGNQASNQANGLRLKGAGTTRHYFWGNDNDQTTGDISSDTSGPNGDGWHHFAVKFDGANDQWYWNGAPLGLPFNTGGTVNVANLNHRIGSRLGAEYFDGLIDEVRIWDKARSHAEIAGDFEQELSGTEANLVAYFDFEGDLGDRAGGDNNGTAVDNASINAAAGAPIGTSGGPVIESFTTTHPARFEGESATLAWGVDPDLVTGTLLVEILDTSDTVIHSTANAIGTFPIAIVDTAGVAQTWTYTLRASESGGAMVSRESTIDIAVDPGIPVATPQSLQTVGMTPLPIDFNGTDPNMHPNPTVSFSIGNVANGIVTPGLHYVANDGFFGTDTIEFTVFDGKYDSALAMITVDVIPPPSSPTDISLSTTNIGENVLSTSFVATLFTNDANASDTHTYSLVAGAGDTDNASFSIVGNQLRAATNFTGQVGNTFSIRLRTLDGGGLSYQESFTLTVVTVSDAVVINEIHYNPPENPVRQEFIELHNPSATEADLSAWRLTSAVDFVFPGGTTIPAGGYLVIAEDPATLLATLGATALGPYLGSLNSDGETVRLRDANDNIVDEVDYKVGFPWPVSANGNGPSIELINPELDNSLGSSWRSAGLSSGPPPDPVTYLAAADSAWHYRKGQTNNPPNDGGGRNWTEQSYDESADNIVWTSPAQTPIGYGDGDDNTVLADMSGSYSTVYLRHEFTIPDTTADDDVPAQLALRLYIDDGCIAYINGNEVSRQFVSGGAKNYNSLTDQGDHERSWETVLLNSAAAGIVEGTNTLAIHAINASLGSSDLSVDAEVKTPTPDDIAGNPTPGAQNSSFADNAPPNIRKVNHTPTQPTATDAVVITAKVTDPHGIHSVNLEYQVVAAGAYVPANLPHPVPNIPTDTDRPENPSYSDAANWTTLVMDDNGADGDALAGDDIYSVIIPAQAHRSLVRYRIRIEDGLDMSVQVPYSDDARLNFAYFVYDGVPAYEGNNADVMENTLPVYHLITRPEDYSECIAYSGGDQIPQGGQARFFYNWSGTIVYDGVVYDNIRFRLRGANGRYQSAGKRSMRFRFNEGDFLQARDHFGKNYNQKWRTLTLGKCSSNRLTLTYGLNEVVNFYLFDKIGVPAANAQWLQWRVIDSADENPDPSHGDFHGIYLITETYDVRFLEEHNLEKGNLYKLINQTQDWQQQQRYQAAFAPTDGSDHNTIEGSLSGNSTADYIRAHVDVEKWTRSHALVQAIRHYDYWPSANKNMVYYFEPDYLSANNNNGKLWILPWDTDATWGPTYNSGHDVVYNSLFSSSGGGSDGGTTPELWADYYNEVREIRDLLWQTDQINPLIDEIASFIAPLEAADGSRWKNTPADAGNYNGLHGPGKTSLAAYVQDMKNFAFVGGSWDGGGVGGGGRANDLDVIQGQNGESGQIPNTPTITYTGSANFPTNALSFQSSSFGDPQGNGSFGAMEWRIAQITDATAPAHDSTDRFKLEIEADWESGELGTFSNAIDIPTVAVRSGLTYRARVRHQDATGRWSHWSAPVEFTSTLPDISDYIAGLVVTEVMYHPTDPSAAEINAGYDDDDFFEYIELKNVGAVTLDLQDLRFTKGVDFDFLGAAITSIAPGEIVLVIKDIAAFELRYGAGLPIAGAWQSTDKLDNGGEQVKLSFGAGDPIRDFVYDDISPWPTSPDGSGPSLTLQNPDSVPDHALAASWVPSAGGGTPGVDDAGVSYGTWRDAIFGPGNPPGSGELDDADFDGVVNLLEYAAGTDPLNASIAPITQVGTHAIGADEFLTITYTRRTDRPDVGWSVEWSQDLAGWD
ncbi:MAG: spore coat protein CotH, partial [Verrucomicrobiales bacterium]